MKVLKLQTRPPSLHRVPHKTLAPDTQGNKLPDYTMLRLTLKQKIVSYIVSGLLLWGTGYLFFHQVYLAVLLTAGASFGPKVWSRFLLDRRRGALTVQFKQMLYSLSTSLAAGRSVENGFRESINDLLFLYPDGEVDMIKELKTIYARLEYGEPLESALQDLSRRAGLEDITHFSDVFITCKRTGGDLVEVIRRTSALISEKMEIKLELGVMLAQKKLESRLLLGAPIFFLIFMELSSPDYMAPLYSGIGLLISGSALALFVLCFWLVQKIMNIKI